MILCTIKKQKDYSIDFIKYVQQQIKIKFILLVDKKRLTEIEKQIKQLYPISNTFNLYEICINSIERSLIVEDDIKYEIIVNPDLKLYNIRIKTLFQAINDGNLDMPAYPIFSEIQKIIENNLSIYFRMYQFGVSR